MENSSVKKDFLNLETKIKITWPAYAADIWTDAEQCYGGFISFFSPSYVY